MNVEQATSGVNWRAPQPNLMPDDPLVTLSDFSETDDYPALERYLDVMCRDIHADNVTAGWWSDMKTGLPLDRNRGEMLMLIVSELSEASLGIAGDLFDDKLRHRKMFGVELADAAIRVCDLMGSLGEGEFEGFVRGSYSRITSAESGMRLLTPDAQLMLIVNAVSEAMEHDRKKRAADFQLSLMDVLSGIIALARHHRVPLFALMDEKRAFNATRADHKIENRQAEGGKTY